MGRQCPKYHGRVREQQRRLLTVEPDVADLDVSARHYHDGFGVGLHLSDHEGAGLVELTPPAMP